MNETPQTNQWVLGLRPFTGQVVEPSHATFSLQFKYTYNTLLFRINIQNILDTSTN